MSGRMTDFSRVMGMDPGIRSFVRSAQCNPDHDVHTLRMGYVKTGTLGSLVEASAFNFLGIVRHDRSPGDPNAFGVCPVVCLGRTSGHAVGNTDLERLSTPTPQDSCSGLSLSVTDMELLPPH